MESEVSLTMIPDFIRFLFSAKPKFDCYFIVGNKSQGEPERIGAVKLMLMAHSEVFRLELEDSDLAEKGDVPVEDVHPATFKGMLKYVYGNDTTSDLCFDEADNLLYVAEKYMMKSLKNKLAVRLIKLLNTDNICSLLNNPACYTHLELDSAITEILRSETDRVLSSPQFVLMNATGFLKILEQDGLAVPEIELWRAAIKWAKHRAHSEDGKQIRQQLSPLTQHLKLCTLTQGDIFQVIQSGVLSCEEAGAVCISIARKEKPQPPSEFCNEIEPRKLLKRKRLQHKLELNNVKYSRREGSSGYYFKLLTKKNYIQLLPLVFSSIKQEKMSPEQWTYEVDCIITITEEENPEGDSEVEKPPITVTFRGRVKFGVKFAIPLAVGGRNITLLPDTLYRIEIKWSGKHKVYSNEKQSFFSNDHLALTITTFHHGFLTQEKGDGFLSPFRYLRYVVSTEQ